MNNISNLADKLQNSIFYKRRILLRIIDQIVCAADFVGNDIDEFISHIYFLKSSHKEQVVPAPHPAAKTWHTEDPTRVIKGEADIVLVGKHGVCQARVRDNALFVGGQLVPWRLGEVWVYAPDEEVRRSPSSEFQVGDAVVYLDTGAHIHLRGRVGKVIAVVHNSITSAVTFTVRFAPEGDNVCHAHEIKKLPRRPKFFPGDHVLVKIERGTEARVITAVSENSEGKFYYLVATEGGVERSCEEHDIKLDAPFKRSEEAE